jgi:hypothetical protein
MFHAARAARAQPYEDYDCIRRENRTDDRMTYGGGEGGYHGAGIPEVVARAA